VQVLTSGVLTVQIKVPRVRLARGFGHFGSRALLHDAGWDALATGAVFARLRPLARAHESALLGQIYLPRAFKHVALGLRGPDVPPGALMFLEVHIAHAIGESDIRALFSPYSVKLGWIEEGCVVNVPGLAESACVALINREGRGDQWLERGVAIMTLGEFKSRWHGSGAGTGGSGGGGWGHAGSPRRGVRGGRGGGRSGGRSAGGGGASPGGGDEQLSRKRPFEPFRPESEITPGPKRGSSDERPESARQTRLRGMGDAETEMEETEMEELDAQMLARGYEFKV
jgi:hypothetical protein